VKLRTRIAVAITLLLLVLSLGFGLGTHANAAPKRSSGGTSTNGCIVVPPLELAACLGRF
jgi:hypothetical protein